VYTLFSDAHDERPDAECELVDSGIGVANSAAGLSAALGTAGPDQASDNPEHAPISCRFSMPLEYAIDKKKPPKSGGKVGILWLVEPNGLLPEKNYIDSERRRAWPCMPTAWPQTT